MKPRRLLQPTLILIALEGLLCAAWLLAVPSDAAGAVALGLSAARLALLGIIVAGVLIACALALVARRDEARVWIAANRWLDSRAALVGTLVVSALSLLLVLHRHIAPAVYAAEVSRLLPLAAFGLLASGHLLLLAFLAGDREWKQRAFLIVLLPVLLVFYWDATNYFSTLNHDWKNSDQGIFINFAYEVAASGYTFTGGRNFMPLYPFLLAPLLDAGRAFFENFELAKTFNTLLSMGLLASFFWLVKAHLSRGRALLLTLLAAFTLYIYKAPYSQPEVLFYFLFFVAFLLSCRLILRPEWQTAALLGLTLAAAHLTKASALPLAALVLATLAGLALAAALRRGRDTGFQLATPRAYLLSLALVAVVFVSALWPYISESKARYGQYFYNVNTTFYAWYDSWREATEGTRAHGDGVGWPELPENQIPSPSRYLQTHSAVEIGARLWRGVQNQAANLWNTFSLVSYPLLLAALVTLAAWANRPRARELWRRYWPLIGFVALMWGGYLLAYAWYGPIADYADQRFTYSLMLPMLFAGCVALRHLLEGDEVVTLLGRAAAAGVWRARAFGAIAFVLAVDILFWVPVKLAEFGWYGK